VRAQEPSQSSRKFMRLAISEMLRSLSEHTNKPDPLVGAVLVNSVGGIVGKAHRGKYGDGEHGEFTLLEKSGQIAYLNTKNECFEVQF